MPQNQSANDKITNIIPMYHAIQYFRLFTILPYIKPPQQPQNHHGKIAEKFMTLNNTNTPMTKDQHYS